MQHSEQIGELAGALAKAQGEIEGAAKSSANPYFKSKYADLSEVWDACRGPLSANGLAVSQLPVTRWEKVGEEFVLMAGVTTILSHDSGQWIKDTLLMPVVKSDPQGVGSCVTYARRYALAAFVGVAPEDDDGNAASGHAVHPGPQVRAGKPAAKPAPPPPAPESLADKAWAILAPAARQGPDALHTAWGAVSKDMRKAVGEKGLEELKAIAEEVAHAAS